MDISRSKTQSWFRSWRRWGWTMLAGLFGALCLGAGWLASEGTDSRVRMAFVLLSLSFFLYGFFQYFFAMVAFSAAHRHAERKNIQKTPPRTSLTLLLLVLGLIAVSGLLGLWWWRLR